MVAVFNNVVICSNNLNSLLNLNLVFETLGIGQEVPYGFDCWEDSTGFV